MLGWVLCFFFFQHMSLYTHVCARLGVDCVSSRGDRGHSEAGISDLALLGRLYMCVSMDVCACLFLY